MAIGFPPVPVYPLGIDSDSTLFHVYNTTETKTASNNQALSDSIDIIPVDDTADEIWGLNGFANINGELLYYDSVDTNAAGKIIRLNRCARGIGGSPSVFNPSGTWIRSFVIAEHHNQIVDAIIAIEHFIGIICDPNQINVNLNTLDCQIRVLEEEPICASDNDCPTVTLTVTNTTPDNCVGTTITYEVDVLGDFNQFTIDFGDGNSSTELSGTYTYSPGATIDPVVTVSNDSCQIVQTAPARDNPLEPPAASSTPPFEINIPTFPILPSITIPTIDIPITTLTLPPILPPCIEIGPLGSVNFSIPSTISIIGGTGLSNVVFGPLSVPSLITFSPVTIPTLITFSPVTIPTQITFSPVTIPTLITFSPVTIPTQITFSPVTIPTLINFGPVTIPTLINFGPVTVPTLIKFGPVTIPTLINFGPVNIPTLITITPVYIPTLITITPVTIPTLITFTPITIPTIIDFGPVTVPTMIDFGPVTVPTMIDFGPVTVPTMIDFGPVTVPTMIDFGPVTVPTMIDFGPVTVPTMINFGPVTVPTMIDFGPVTVPTMISFGPVNVPTMIDFGPVTVPTEINFGPVNVPTEISFGPASVPTMINFGPAPQISPVSFGPAPTISPVSFGPAPQISPVSFGPAPTISPVSFGPAPTISPVSFGPAPTISPVSFGPAPTISPVSFGPAPSVSVDWGSPPTVSCVVSVNCPGSSVANPNATKVSNPFAPPAAVPSTDGFENFIEVETAGLNIPSEIMIVAPKLPDMRIVHDIPSVIAITAPKIQDIRIVGPVVPLPTQIEIIDKTALPKSIALISENIPSSIKLDAGNIPQAIRLEMPENFPSVIKFDATGIPKTIQVVGIPDSIELKGYIPSEIFIKAPENLEVPLVYKGGPIPISLDMKTLTGPDGEDLPCFAIVPCKK